MRVIFSTSSLVVLFNGMIRCYLYGTTRSLCFWTYKLPPPSPPSSLPIQSSLPISKVIFFFGWNGSQHGRNSMQDGTYGTTCPIPLGNNFTYMLQAKDQIGSFLYFLSLGLQKASRGYGGMKLYSRPRIRSSFLSLPEIKLFLLVIGKKGHQTKTHIGHG
ncbi:putative cupredoxin, multicopper oxidase, type 3 [Helianthus anomalus]